MAVLALLILSLAPQDAETLVRAADIKFKDRDIEGALADYGRAIQVDARCAPAYYGRGQIRANKGQLPEAEADYTKAVEIDPKFAKAWFGRALLRTYTNNEPGAMADFTKAVTTKAPLKNAEPVETTTNGISPTAKSSSSSLRLIGCGSESEVSAHRGLGELGLGPLRLIGSVIHQCRSVVQPDWELVPVSDR